MVVKQVTLLRERNWGNQLSVRAEPTVESHPLSAPVTASELIAIRARSGMRRDRFCGALLITSNQLSAFEKGDRDVPVEVSRMARILDGQGSDGKHVGIATFGDNFVVVLLSLIKEVGLWRADVLPVLHDDRASAMAAGRDYAKLNGYAFSAIGFPAPSDNTTT